jgi:hypothetical protein
MSPADRLTRYPSVESYFSAWSAVADAARAEEQQIGQSSEGRPLVAYRFGRRGGTRVLLTSLIHGLEYIGALASLELMRRLFTNAGSRSERALGRTLADELELVVVPAVNPDGFAYNLSRLRAGLGTGKRANGRGVDLNRNFPAVGKARPWHPFAGSSWSWSPHYRGPGELSESESAAIARLARELRPDASLGFHSFGNLLLYPWGHTREANPREEEYRRLGDCFGGAPGVELPVGTPTSPTRYLVRQAIGLYPTAGDLDDWLDAELGTLAMTVEVSTLDARLLQPRHFLNPFWWMNPAAVEPTLDHLVPGLERWLGGVAELAEPKKVQPIRRGERLSARGRLKIAAR